MVKERSYDGEGYIVQERFRCVGLQFECIALSGGSGDAEAEESIGITERM
jgi:hypothetical protein